MESVTTDYELVEDLHIVQIMGLKSFTRYLSLQHHTGAIVKFPLGCTDDGKRQVLIVDGNALMYFVYRRAHLDSWLGGAYKQYSHYVRLFVRMLVNAGLRLIVCFDGENPFKSKTRDIRTIERANDYAALWIQFKTRLTNEWPECIERRFVLPGLTPFVIRQALMNEKHVIIRQCLGESDEELVRLYHSESAFGILSEDSDFYLTCICDVVNDDEKNNNNQQQVNWKGIQYLPLSKLVYNNDHSSFNQLLSAIIYKTEHTAQLLGMSLDQLPLLASFIPNDYLTSLHLRDLHSRLCRVDVRNRKRKVAVKRRLVQSAAKFSLDSTYIIEIAVNFIRQHELFVNPIIANKSNDKNSIIFGVSSHLTKLSIKPEILINTIFGKDESEKASFAIRLQSCLSEYSVQPIVNNEILPNIFKEHLLSCSIPYFLCSVLMNKHVSIRMSFSSFKYTYDEYIVPMRRRFYGILLDLPELEEYHQGSMVKYHKDTIMKVHEYCISHRSSSNMNMNMNIYAETTHSKFKTVAGYRQIVENITHKISEYNCTVRNILVDAIDEQKYPHGHPFHWWSTSNNSSHYCPHCQQNKTSSSSSSSSSSLETTKQWFLYVLGISNNELNIIKQVHHELDNNPSLEIFSILLYMLKKYPLEESLEKYKYIVLETLISMVLNTTVDTALINNNTDSSNIEPFDRMIMENTAGILVGYYLELLQISIFTNSSLHFPYSPIIVEDLYDSMSFYHRLSLLGGRNEEGKINNNKKIIQILTC